MSVRPEDRELHWDLEFDAALTLTGQVIYGGEPLPGADVGLRGTDGRTFRGNTSEAGNRRQWPLEGGRVTVPSLPPGLWTLHVTAPDGTSWSGSVPIEAGIAAAVTCAAGHCALGTETATVE